MKTKIFNLKNRFKVKMSKNSIYLGIAKGYSVPLLPFSLEKFYNNKFIRILRVIGGISFIIVVTKIYLYFPDNLHLFITIIAAIQITQIIIVFLIKCIYGLYTLKYRKDKFEVRNSPLDKYASMIAKVLYCVKYGCAVSGIGASLIAAP